MTRSPRHPVTRHPSPSLHGYLVIDKPAGLTSFDVVARARRLLGEKRIGHAGTLDPAATGVLPLAVGAATKTLEFLTRRLQDLPGRRHLRRRDRQPRHRGPVTRVADAEALTAEQVDAALAGFRGPGEQIPPMHAAIKVGGQKLYDLARRGEEIPRAPRPVTFHRPGDARLGAADRDPPRRLLQGDVYPRPGPRPRRGARDGRLPLQSGPLAQRAVPSLRSDHPGRAGGGRAALGLAAHRRASRCSGVGLARARAGSGRRPPLAAGIDHRSGGDYLRSHPRLRCRGELAGNRACRRRREAAGGHARSLPRRAPRERSSRPRPPQSPPTISLPASASSPSARSTASIAATGGCWIRPSGVGRNSTSPSPASPSSRSRRRSCARRRSRAASRRPRRSWSGWRRRGSTRSW